MIVNVSMNLTELEAFNILLQTLNVELKENIPSFKVNEFGDIVCDYDDRGELYLALYHLATKICPNTEFRNLFEDPNTIMASLYTEAKAESENNGEASDERKIYEQVGDAMFFLPEYAYGSRNIEKTMKPVPKGHGRLIDADRLEKDMNDALKNSLLTYEAKIFVEFMCYVDEAPTILEADKEG